MDTFENFGRQKKRMRGLSCIRSVGLLAFLLSGGTLATAQQSDVKTHLPIDVPHAASVEFEAYTPGSEILPFIRQFVTGDFADFSSTSKSDRIPIKTSLGEFDLRTQDVAILLQPIREIHVVVFRSDEKEDSLRKYERTWENEGFHSEVTPSIAKGVLLMRHRRTQGSYALALKKGDRITVIRTDGFPDLGELGDVILRAIGDVVQKAVFHRHHETR